MRLEMITISLTSDEAASLRNAVEAGDYSSIDEAVRHAVKEWRERRDLFGYTIEELRTFVQQGLESGPAQYESISDVKLAGRRRFKIEK